MKGMEESRAATGDRWNWKMTMELDLSYIQKARQQYYDGGTWLESLGQEIKSNTKR